MSIVLDSIIFSTVVYAVILVLPIFFAVTSPESVIEIISGLDIFHFKEVLFFSFGVIHLIISNVLPFLIVAYSFCPGLISIVSIFSIGTSIVISTIFWFLTISFLEHPQPVIPIVKIIIKIIGSWKNSPVFNLNIGEFLCLNGLKL